MTTEEYILESGLDIVFPLWSEANSKNGEIPKDLQDEFIKKFMKGFENRPSVRVSNPSTTTSDLVIDHIIKARIPKFTEREIELIRIGHRLSMATENILGLMLEEYIHSKVIDFGWSCCWGNSFPKVDFCSKKGELLQVKNRSNTENSSSNKIRESTEIKKWFRINAQNGKTYWDDLNILIGKKNLLSEDNFIKFCASLIKKNPYALHVESEKFLK